MYFYWFNHKISAAASARTVRVSPRTGTSPGIWKLPPLVLRPETLRPRGGFPRIGGRIGGGRFDEPSAVDLNEAHWRTPRPGVAPRCVPTATLCWRGDNESRTPSPGHRIRGRSLPHHGPWQPSSAHCLLRRRLRPLCRNHCRDRRPLVCTAGLASSPPKTWAGCPCYP